MARTLGGDYDASVIETSAFRLWISVTRAPDVRGAWLAHCLDLDVMTQSDSLEHAFEQVREAVSLVLVDDLRSGRDPLATRATAPPAAWAELWRVIDLAEKRPPGEPIPAHQERVQVLVAQCVVHVRRVPLHQRVASEQRKALPNEIPLALAIYEQRATG